MLQQYIGINILNLYIWHYKHAKIYMYTVVEKVMTENSRKKK